MTQAAKVIPNPQSKKQSFECFLSRKIFKCILIFSNRKVKEVCRTLSQSCKINVNIFPMDELKAGTAIIFRAGNGRDNFSDVGSPRMPDDSKPFYRDKMSLGCFKLFLKCFQFDSWNTRGERKSHDKFSAVLEIYNIFCKIYDRCTSLDMV